MATIQTRRQELPQAYVSSFAPRLRAYKNSLLTPVYPQANTVPPTRTTKRGTIAINYAEDGYDDTDFDDGDGPRRFTGLRSLRRDDSNEMPQTMKERSGKELKAPVEMQGIYRNWMSQSKRVYSNRHSQAQSELPVTLIPIRLDLEIQPFIPDAALSKADNLSKWPPIDESLPAFRRSELTPQFRLRDTFMWNLYETLITPEHFAATLVNELDFPNDRKGLLIHQIVTAIRTQLEEYASVATHPLFNTCPSSKNNIANPTIKLAENTGALTPLTNGGTPFSIPATNGFTNRMAKSATPRSISQQRNVSASAVTINPPETDAMDGASEPDDMYRCIVSLNVNINNKLYSDKFEWSLLHPPGYPEAFARQTCADLGLAGEWVPAITHAIYEAVLRLKKEACENGGSMLIMNGGQHLENDAAHGDIAAGWRYCPDGLGEEWEPKVELLSKEEIDRREGDRERQIRRQRRETAARFSFMPYGSLAGNATGLRLEPTNSNDYWNNPTENDQPMGRGERSKRKRRYRSVSPATGGRDGLDQGGLGGTSLTDIERRSYRCSHCKLWGSAIWAVRDGPAGPRSLCHNCGYLYERDGKLPGWSAGLFQH